MFIVCKVPSYTLSHLNIIKIPKGGYYHVPYLINEKMEINEIT